MPYITIFGILKKSFSFFLRQGFFLENLTFCDTHIHLSRSRPLTIGSEYFCVTSCHVREDFDISGGILPFPRSGLPRFAGERMAPPASAGAFFSFGIHPQAVSPSFMGGGFHDSMSFLESLLRDGKIAAVGECGFDFFTPGLRASAMEQESVFDAQLSLALGYGFPMILHLRKSIEKIFSYSKELRKLPAVVFHSFPGTLREALSLLDHGLNAFFSFGKPILNGKKSAVDCVGKLPVGSILLETDSPYQRLRDEDETRPDDIVRVYERAALLRGMGLEELSCELRRNFFSAFRPGL